MRGGVFPGSIDEPPRPRADRGRAADGGPGPRACGDARRSRHSARRRRRPADRGDRHRHQGLDGARARRARRARRAAPLHQLRRGAARRPTPTPSSSPTAPATPPRSPTSSRPCASSSGRKPVWGICLGHQLLCRAVGLETFKLPFGHRGANHPVRDLPPAASRSPPRTTASPRSGPAAGARSTPTSRCAGRPTSARPRSRT